MGHSRFLAALHSVLRLLLIGILSIMSLVPQFSVAAASLTITPDTWNIIGLDSNSPATGPSRFPIGAKVCSSVATSNVAVNFIWDDGNNAYTGDPYINLRTGSLSSITIPSISAGPGGCADAYFEVQVLQNATAFDKTRRYHITATDSSGTVAARIICRAPDFAEPQLHQRSEAGRYFNSCGRDDEHGRGQHLYHRTRRRYSHPGL